MQILTNHIGYPCFSSKNAVVLASTLDENITAQLINAKTHRVENEMAITPVGKVANWHQGQFYRIDFSSFSTAGRYYLAIGSSQSHPFEINNNLLMKQTFSDVMHYFKSQRCGGIFDQQDRHIPLLNRDTTVDVHGGWYDASGDVSKYFSHLSYANYLNPQQIPMVVWNMLKGLSLTTDISDFAKFSTVRLTEEALFGADFLVRMQNPEGFFYTTVFDKWSKDVKQREICSYQTQNGDKFDDYQAGFRQGGGVAIAALASASRLEQHGDYTQNQYLEAAIKGYQHLCEHNTQYLNDGTENIIDEYCALLAATELFKTTQKNEFLLEARRWATALMNRQCGDQNFSHYWSANQDGSRPYFHASEAGLPVIALTEYLSIENDAPLAKLTQSVIENALRFELTITHKVNNPFSYPRQYVKAVDGEKREAFFVAQNNESGYWWQGENARLASLSTMASIVQSYISDPGLKCQLKRFAQSSLDWILGLNPYDMCMLDGHGHNNPDYLPDLGFFNAKGGVCNGITSGFDDEQDIAFNPEGPKDDMLQNWRWGEQWIPHGAWYLLAIIAQQHHLDTEQKEYCHD
ncbi:glycoside hydrolase family 9 protein [Vibrio rumoiensis]|uniref:Chitobiase n=1 Tax=Vibrio rumoiensis 1S-45 TaxID=1188252 RepID=A0A1E5DYF9_9VIBR|nr:glycoside hydrolase family 9 protein [Vibrio rumoiensis]OEF22636.1 chitobiase [Vibrio rumoiensis 1S-45]